MLCWETSFCICVIKTANFKSMNNDGPQRKNFSERIMKDSVYYKNVNGLKKKTIVFICKFCEMHS